MWYAGLRITSWWLLSSFSTLTIRWRLISHFIGCKHGIRNPNMFVLLREIHSMELKRTKKFSFLFFRSSWVKTCSQPSSFLAWVIPWLIRSSMEPSIYGSLLLEEVENSPAPSRQPSRKSRTSPVTPLWSDQEHVSLQARLSHFY